MKSRSFGRTGLRVSPLCLGTMTFGKQCDEETSAAILDKAFDAGISFIDTADAYPSGQDADEGLSGRTEEIVGGWMTGKRDQVVLASKFYFPMGPNPWDMGASRRHIMDAIDASLARLQTDYLDLYQIHFWDEHTPIDETLGALDDLVRIGKVRYVGCSNHAAWQIARALGRSEARDIVRYESVQPRYNLLFRNIERDILPLAEHDQLAVIPYNPIAGGMLTGKHVAEGGPTAGGRFSLGRSAETYRGRYWADDKFAMVAALQEVAAESGRPLVEMALAWVMAHPQVTAPIIGASKPDQLDASLAALANPLDGDLKQRLDDMTMQYRTVDIDR